MPVIITSKQEGFRRCGMAHPANAVEHADGTFTEDQLAALKAEPRQTPRRRLVYSCSSEEMAWLLVRRSPSFFPLAGENRRCREKGRMRRSAGGGTCQTAIADGADASSLMSKQETKSALA